MTDDVFTSLRPTLPAPTPLYGLRPAAEGTGDVESLFSYFLGLSHAHRLTPKSVIDVVLPDALAKLPRSHGTRLAWGWDKHAGKELIGANFTADRWATILGVATGQTALQNATLVPLAAHVFGDLTTDRERICPQCQAEDHKGGRLPYGRLLWRLKAVTCCPIHRCALVEPVCGRPKAETKRQFSRVKLAGVCRECGSVAHECNSTPTHSVTEDEVWRAEQCRRMIAAFPGIAASNPHLVQLRIKERCAAPGALTSLALRSGATISVLSRWLKQPGARLSFDQILDICGTESIDLAELLQGRLVVVNQGLSIAPIRKKRTVRAADHAAIRSALKSAVAEGESVTVVAERLCVDIRTLAQHADLYDVVRQATRDRMAAANAARQNEAIAKAEAIAKKLLAAGRPLTSRNAKRHGADFYPSDVGWAVLALIRIGLGDRSLRRPALAARLGQAFFERIEAAVARVRAFQGDPQQRLQLDPT